MATLANSGFDTGAVAEAWPLAVATAARSTESYGAVDALAPTIDLG
jgi:ABC-type enterochelin transport system substrate-binding protein